MCGFEVETVYYFVKALNLHLFDLKNCLCYVYKKTSIQFCTSLCFNKAERKNWLLLVIQLKLRACSTRHLANGRV